MRTLKIGITGGIGSGKTTISNLFKKFGAPVYNSDDRAKWLMNNDPLIVKKVTRLFGPEAYVNKELNRPYIASVVFTNSILISELNKTIHPAVFLDFDNWVEKQKAPYILKEAALLFESGSYLGLDAMIVVDAPLKIRLERVMKRDSIDKNAVMKRMNNQLDDKVKKNGADFIINNDGNPLIPQILMLHKLWS